MSRKIASNDERPAVRCGACELRQFAQERCRRCGKPLPKPTVEVRYVERVVVQVAEEKPVEALQPPVPTTAAAKASRYLEDWPNPLPTVEELTNELIVEAMWRCHGHWGLMELTLGLGHTTIGRYLQKLKLTNAAKDLRMKHYAERTCRRKGTAGVPVQQVHAAASGGEGPGAGEGVDGG